MIRGVLVAAAVALVAQIEPTPLPEFLLVQLPIGLAVVAVLYSPWVALIMLGRLRPGSQFKEVTAAADKAVAAAEKAASERIAAVEAERDREVAALQAQLEVSQAQTTEWKQAWGNERERGDKATLAVAAANGEVASVTHKLIEVVTNTGDNRREALELGVGGSE